MNAFDLPFLFADSIVFRFELGINYATHMLHVVCPYMTNKHAK
jgi:hypothetical protein